LAADSGGGLDVQSESVMANGLDGLSGSLSVEGREMMTVRGRVQTSATALAMQLVLPSEHGKELVTDEL
jgi:hypothetical protein